MSLLKPSPLKNPAYATVYGNVFHNQFFVEVYFYFKQLFCLVFFSGGGGESEKTSVGILQMMRQNTQPIFDSRSGINFLAVSTALLQNFFKIHDLS